jgi:pimeloyl-ACP methyl ester carboxylesterase
MKAMQRVPFEVPAGRLNAVAAGPEDGRVLLLLHGFPDFSYGWRKQIPALAAAGLRVIALDQRGYNESAKPAGIRPYELPRLVGDVLAVCDQLGRKRVYLAGHDWGGIVAWAVSMRHPDRVDRLAILNAPHPAVARRYLTSNLRQMLSSWYLLLFQIPGLPEKLFAAKDFKIGVRTLETSSLPGTFSRDDLQEYRRAWSHPGALTAMINWYRALARFSQPADFAGVRIPAPSLLLWGGRDKFLLTSMAQECVNYCDHGHLVVFPGETHWLHLEEPERVNRLLVEHFSS